MRRSITSLLLALFLPFALVGCGDEQPAVNDEADQGADTDAPEEPAETQENDVTLVEGDAGVTVTGEPGAKPTITIPDGEAPKELMYSDLVVGDGAEAPRGAAVVMHYLGVAWSNKQQFDASWDSGKPLDYPLSQLIRGWQEGVPGMKVGGRRLLVIPPELGYGEQGTPGGPIGPNETLVFVIDLLEVK
jgi:peptidylprolyl isomerase